MPKGREEYFFLHFSPKKTTHDDGRQTIAVGQLSHSGDLKMVLSSVCDTDDHSNTVRSSRHAFNTLESTYTISL